ncbi:2-succinyl-5-enolpyruvyl-6-hydroxy-3-cyclohexene-1-carboxylic-acid synthase [uncultured Endozoicomonas sp.]|uniref:2-succinyl-5-enolpyruvyl-6-hydroxy-3- cyclohexene-1-carboxylic-acid synthase n=1 Tax=uncultured Endozoicomonas sp. TaxID=432652 RepID=UPI00261A0472|nr:2-succinyl-5-enolpyruvyl-6-hydroxy-3-cyclohexene-1-carboxylic-acid synthase [uncultured Endozoicomonas sp.]
MTFKTGYANINTVWSSVLIEELWRLGVRHCCIAPGSRSAPLTFAVAAHDGITRHVHFDERGLGFFALGLAKATNEPVAVITTSGTAVANLFPAIIEARQSGVPLVVLTADRPPELIDCGANQAIDQLGIFGDYTGARLDLPTPDRKISLRWLLGSIDQSFSRSCALQLPLHINCMFREPLYPHQSDGENNNELSYFSEVESWLSSRSPYTEYMPLKSAQVPDESRWQRFADGKGIIVVGRISNHSDTGQIIRLADRLGWPVITDVQSQLHGHPRATKYPDLMLASDSGLTLFKQADRILQFGGYLTSKRLDQFITRHSWIENWMVDPAARRVDAGQRQSLRIIGNIDDLCQQLVDLPLHKTDSMAWKKRFDELSEKLHDYLEASAPELLNERWLGTYLAENLPDNAGVFLGNSLPIRMVEIFTSNQLPNIYSSRGASGIDGLIATASGCAVGGKQPLVLLIGDISFFHDLNSLQLARQAKYPLVIVMVNNDGGGIFYVTSKGCDEDQAQVAKDYFVTPHGLTAKHASALFGIEYASPDSPEAFTSCFAQAMTTPGCTLIEVMTPSGQGAELISESVSGVSEL